MYIAKLWMLIFIDFGPLCLAQVLPNIGPRQYDRIGNVANQGATNVQQGRLYRRNYNGQQPQSQNNGVGPMQQQKSRNIFQNSGFGQMQPQQSGTGVPNNIFGQMPQRRFRRQATLPAGQTWDLPQTTQGRAAVENLNTLARLAGLVITGPKSQNNRSKIWQQQQLEGQLPILQNQFQQQQQNQVSSQKQRNIQSQRQQENQVPYQQPNIQQAQPLTQEQQLQLEIEALQKQIQTQLQQMPKVARTRESTQQQNTTRKQQQHQKQKQQQQQQQGQQQLRNQEIQKLTNHQQAKQRQQQRNTNKRNNARHRNMTNHWNSQAMALKDQNVPKSQRPNTAVLDTSTASNILLRTNSIQRQIVPRNTVNAGRNQRQQMHENVPKISLTNLINQQEVPSSSISQTAQASRQFEAASKAPLTAMTQHVNTAMSTGPIKKFHGLQKTIPEGSLKFMLGIKPIAQDINQAPNKQLTNSKPSNQWEQGTRIRILSNTKTNPQSPKEDLHSKNVRKVQPAQNAIQRQPKSVLPSMNRLQTMTPTADNNAVPNTWQEKIIFGLQLLAEHSSDHKAQNSSPAEPWPSQQRLSQQRPDQRHSNSILPEQLVQLQLQSPSPMPQQVPKQNRNKGKITTYQPVQGGMNNKNIISQMKPDSFTMFAKMQSLLHDLKSDKIQPHKTAAQQNSHVEQRSNELFVQGSNLDQQGPAPQQNNFTQLSMNASPPQQKASLAQLQASLEALGVPAETVHMLSISNAFEHVTQQPTTTLAPSLPNTQSPQRRAVLNRPKLQPVSRVGKRRQGSSNRRQRMRNRVRASNNVQPRRRNTMTRKKQLRRFKTKPTTTTLAPSTTAAQMVQGRNANTLVGNPLKSLLLWKPAPDAAAGRPIQISWSKPVPDTIHRPGSSKQQPVNPIAPKQKVQNGDNIGNPRGLASSVDATAPGQQQQLLNALHASTANAEFDVPPMQRSKTIDFPPRQSVNMLNITSRRPSANTFDLPSIPRQSATNTFDVPPRQPSANTVDVPPGVPVANIFDVPPRQPAGKTFDVPPRQQAANTFDVPPRQLASNTFDGPPRDLVANTFDVPPWQTAANTLDVPPRQAAANTVDVPPKPQLVNIMDVPPRQTANTFKVSPRQKSANTLNVPPRQVTNTFGTPQGQLGTMFQSTTTASPGILTSNSPHTALPQLWNFIRRGALGMSQLASTSTTTPPPNSNLGVLLNTRNELVSRLNSIASSNNTTQTDKKRNRTISITTETRKVEHVPQHINQPMIFNIMNPHKSFEHPPQTPGMNVTKAIELINMLKALKALKTTMDSQSTGQGQGNGFGFPNWQNFSIPNGPNQPVKIVLQLPEVENKYRKVLCKCFPSSDGCPAELKEEPLMDMCQAGTTTPCCEDG